MHYDTDPAASSDDNKFHAFVDDVFLKHPREAGEHYLVHLWEALKMAFALLICVCTAVIHGLLPKFFKTTTGDRVMKLADHIRERRKKWSTPSSSDYH
jgi:hypothetical protein